MRRLRRLCFYFTKKDCDNVMVIKLTSVTACTFSFSKCEPKLEKQIHSSVHVSRVR